MIRPIDIKLNAAHPELPLCEATTFTGAPSSVFICGVPPSVGNWSITAVNVSVTYPDNTTTTRAAVESAEGVWVATIPGTATSGRTTAGFRILADGIDENGAAVMGYALGFADFAVLSFFPVPAPGETFFYLRYFDTMPTAAKKMDVTTINGILEYYNGTAWLPFAAYNDTVTRTSANGVKSSGIWSMIWGALAALPTGFSSLYDWCVAQLAGKASTSDATLTERGPNHDGFSEWIFTPSEFNADTIKMKYVYGGWQPYTDSYGNLGVRKGDVESTMLTWVEGVDFAIGFTATRTALPGYTLGSQTDKPLASEAEAEALRTGLALIAPDWVQTSAYSAYDCVKYNGAYYYAKTDIAANSAWNADNWGSLANLAALAKLFLPLTGGTITGDIILGNSNIALSATGEVVVDYGSVGEGRLFFPLVAGKTTRVADILDIAPTFSTSSTYAQNALCVHEHGLYRCTTAVTTAGAWTSVANWAPLATVEDVLAALRTGKANASDLPYAISESIPLTVTSGAASTTLDDRTHNVRTVAAPGSGNTTTITATLPPIVGGKSRDMFLNLTVGSAASDAGDISLSIVEPSGATVQIDIGSVEDIGIGKNEILISENALPTTSGNVTTTHWLVTVRHEDFAS